MNLLPWQDRHLTSVLMVSFALALSTQAHAADRTAASPYVGQEARSIKALSDSETSDLLAGRGMGYARAAELNKFPGPLHVIELADKLALSPEQRARTEQVFRDMQAQAKAIGAEIVAAEQKLDTAFAAGTIDQASLAAQTEALGQLYGRVRATHLAAHLEMKALLTPQQIAAYNHLRGYTDTPASPHSPQPHGHH